VTDTAIEGVQRVRGAPAPAPEPETPLAATLAPSRPPPKATAALHYGNAPEPMAWIVPDGPLWRMHWPDGQISDWANLSRIRDAAASICERGPPAKNRLRFRWKRPSDRTPVQCS
jgi:hypothetical protein